MLASIIISIFSITPALIFWIYFITYISRRITLIRKGIKTMGSITEWVYHSYFNIKGLDFYYSPIIRFLDDKNKEILFESSYRTSIGKMWSSIRFSDNKVNVIYDKQNPIECEMNSFAALWGASITPFILAIVFTGMSALAIRDLLIVNLDMNKIFEVSLDQLVICVMLLVLFVGVLLLWDLFNEKTPQDNKQNQKINDKK